MARSKAIVVHPQQQQQQQQQQQHQQQHRENVRSIRIRRAILAGKRGPSTPVPSWKLYENPSFNETAAAAAAAAVASAAGTSSSIVASNGRQITVSARKLAATLWELQELPICRVPHSAHKHKGHQRRESVGSPKLMLPPPSPSTPVPQNPAAKPAKSSDSNRRSPFSDTYHSRRTSDTSETSRQSYEESSSHEVVPTFGENFTTCSKEILRMLNNVRSSMDSSNNSNHARTQQQAAALVSLLQAELEQTRQRMKQLEYANKVARHEMSELLEWREQEQERMKAAFEDMQREVDEEKRKKHRLEAANKKLAAQAQEAKLALATATADLDRERKTRQLMEDVCDELAREIGRDKAEVEELKMAACKAREEVEEERRMLQMAEVWREERVQMKLAEARHELEEKNVALDRLKAEMEEFLSAKSVKSTLEPKLTSSLSLTPRDGGQRGGGSSGEDDLHSIDLNKESLYDRTQGNRWTGYGKRQPPLQQQQQQHAREQQQQQHAREDDDRLLVLSSARGMKERRRTRSRSGADRVRKPRHFDYHQQKQQQQKLDGSSSSHSSSTSSESDSNKNSKACRGLKSSSSPGGAFSGRIETIPEHCELFARKLNSPPAAAAAAEIESFSLGFRRPAADGSRTPVLSFNAAAGTSSWNLEASRDNSLRAKLLEEDAIPLRTTRRSK